MLALAWAVYLIPKALKHHDEIARTRSIDRFSKTMRVLARREPVNRRDARLVVTPPRPAAATRMIVPSAPEPAGAKTRPVPRTQARRAAARAAARRRRHILLFLVLVDVVAVSVAAFALAPWWSVSIPVSLTLLYLTLCRRQVRREIESSWTSEAPVAEPTADVAPRPAIRVDAPYGTPSRVVATNAQGFEEVSADEETVTISAAAVNAALTAASAVEADLAAARATAAETVAVSVPTVDGGSLWDPLPVTLPTYVNKPRAARTVRTIDLSEPGTWTSGRSAADSKLVEDATTAQEAATAAQDEQRAVGS